MNFFISFTLFSKYQEKKVLAEFPIEFIIGKYVYPKNISPAIIIKAIDTYIYPIIPVLPWKFLSEDIIFFYKYIIILENS